MTASTWKGTILIVDDERLVRWAMKQRLQVEGWRVLEAGGAIDALEHLHDDLDLLLLDWKLPDGNGLDLLQRWQKAAPRVPVVMVTAHSSVEHAVAAMKQGAWHYLNKPVDLDELAVLADKALETARLRAEVETLRKQVGGGQGLDALVGGSPAMLQVKALLGRVARAAGTTTVLLTGESGTGKDLAARALHQESERARQPFMNITCSALQDTLLESELFGHERGAFTDARSQKKGLLELASGGTVFLDEIGETSPGLQAKLLRFLEDKTFKRVGGAQDIKVDVRVVAATNRDLGAEVKAGRFREDLYYRLRVLPIELPPLRQRDGDVPVLAAAFVQRFNQEFKKTVAGVDADARHLLERYPWPGNVRELKNAVERAMLLSDGKWLGAVDFSLLGPVPGHGGTTGTAGTGAAPVTAAAAFVLPQQGLDMDALERDLVRQALERVGGNQTRAATLLGMSRDQIRYRLEKNGK